MPIEPTPVRVDTISTSSSKTLPSGVRTSTGNLFRAIVLGLGGLLGLRLGLGLLLGLRLGLLLGLGRGLLLLGLRLLLGRLAPARALTSVLGDLVDRPLHVEGALRQAVGLALDDLGERAHRLIDRHVLALGARELLGHEEGLGEEAL